MKEFKVLKILDKLAPIYERIGADYKVVRKILHIKLLMDGRRVPTVFGTNKKSQEDGNNNFMKSLLIYLFMGLFLIPFVVMKGNYMFQMSIAFGIFMFLLITSLISDFSSVLLDVRDKNIIGTKPVNPKTISMAKATHIFIYMFFITIAIIGPSLIVSIFTQGILFFLLYFTFILLINLFVIVITALLYLLILRFFDGEKLKDIINYVQILLSLVIAVGYQFIARLFDIVNLKAQFAPKWWQYFIIPTWFAAPFQILKKSEVNAYYVIFTALAIVVPILSIIVYIKLIPDFEKNLQKLNNNDENNRKKKGKPREFLSKLLCRDREERIFFKFVSDMMRNEREFKLKVYPSLGFSIIFPFIFIFQQSRDMSFQQISMGKSYLFIYFSATMMPNIVMMLKYSGTYKGAWIYKILPIKGTVPIFKGAIKAMIAKLMLPVYIVESAILILIFGVRIVPDLMIVFLNIMIFTVLCFRTCRKSLPFSEAFGAVQQGEGLVLIPTFLLLGVIGYIHYSISSISLGVIIYFVAAVATNVILWKFGFHISQDKLNEG